jgi:WD40 repeat protein
LSVSYSKGGDYFASAGTDEQVMVWKTNFDQIPYQDILESRQQKTTLLGSTTNNKTGNHGKSNNTLKDEQFEIHARPSTTANSNTVNRSERDTSPLTIETNDEINDLDYVTSPKKNVNDVHQNRANVKKLAFNLNTNQSAGNTPNISVAANNNNNNIPANIANTLQHIVQQLDILTQVHLFC